MCCALLVFVVMSSRPLSTVFAKRCQIFATQYWCRRVRQLLTVLKDTRKILRILQWNQRQPPRGQRGDGGAWEVDYAELHAATELETQDKKKWGSYWNMGQLQQAIGVCTTAEVST